LLQLLRSYERVLNARPLAVGNLEFLIGLLRSARVLAEAVRAAAPPDARRELERALRLVDAQTPVDSVELSGNAVAELDRALGTLAPARNPPLRIHTSLPELPRRYNAVTVVFGCGIGLGDEIACLGLLRPLTEHVAPTPLTILTLYRNVWPHLLPDAVEVSYRLRPLRPFQQIATNRPEPDARELVVVLDFESYDLIEKVIPRHPARDVVEISLGETAAWFMGGGSPWLRWERFEPAGEKNYYAFLDAVGDRLFGGLVRRATQPLRRGARRRRSTTRTIVLNPLSSKPLPLAPMDWARSLAALRARDGGSLRVRVYPGLHDVNREYARQICRLARLRDRGLTVELLDADGGRPLTPGLSAPALLDAFRDASLCVTLDTFSAHLAPLAGVPTLVLAYFENREFWVPSPWTFYCVLDRADRELVPLAAELLRAYDAPPRRDALELLAETRALTDAPPEPASIARLSSALARAVPQLDRRLLYAADGRGWLRLWSQLERAIRREPVTAAELHPYLELWRRSELYKVITLPALLAEQEVAVA
jgi:hypothetical protein